MSTEKFGEGLPLLEPVKVEIFRGHRGYYLDTPDETPCVGDLITTAGRNWLALRIGPAVNSPVGWMAVGSGATGAALGDTALVREISRKVLATNTAGITAANVYTAVATWGGAADTVQSIAIAEAGLFNHVGSGQGTLFQRVTFAGVTLADSDLLKVTLETNVGSS